MYLLWCKSSCTLALFPVLMLGLSFSLFSTVIIPAIPLVVEMKYIGTGFGLMGVA
jgi:hypothetical protein